MNDYIHRVERTDRFDKICMYFVIFCHKYSIVVELFLEYAITLIHEKILSIN
jgi:hypothetical protein